jgi:murein DD-endopeptidase MepM/ murein hydrolase activator NlpD
MAVLLLGALFFVVACINGSKGFISGGSPESDIRLPLDTYIVVKSYAIQSDMFSGKFHAAADARGVAGTPVYAIADGIVSFSGKMGGYGWLVTIDHPKLNVYSLYGHLAPNPDSRINDAIKKGQVVGHLAADAEDGSGLPDTGEGSFGGGEEYPYWGPHLHFAIRTGKISNYPDAGDARWMAGYTRMYPAIHGWLDPADFFESRSGITP